MVFLDTSALVKAYVDEPGTETIHELLDRFDGQLYISSFVVLETLATFAYKVRDGRITSSLYRRARRNSSLSSRSSTIWFMSRSELLTLR